MKQCSSKASALVPNPRCGRELLHEAGASNRLQNRKRAVEGVAVYCLCRLEAELQRASQRESALDSQLASVHTSAGAEGAHTHNESQWGAGVSNLCTSEGRGCRLHHSRWVGVWGLGVQPRPEMHGISHSQLQLEVVAPLTTAFPVRRRRPRGPERCSHPGQGAAALPGIRLWREEERGQPGAACDPGG